MSISSKLYSNRLDFDEIFGRNMKVKNEIVTEDYFVQYGINKRKQPGIDIRRAKKNIDLLKLIPEEAKCVFLMKCEGDTMPKLNDNVEVLVLEYVNFTKFPHKFPKNLKELYFIGNKNLKKIPDISYLKNLWSLEIRSSYITFLPTNLPDNIILLDLITGIIKTSLKQLPKKLIHLSIDSCANISKIPDLNYLHDLKSLFVEYRRESPIEINKKTLSMDIEGMVIGGGRIFKL
jgi:Leucine-rich repeat (LRR) protein